MGVDRRRPPARLGSGVPWWLPVAVLWSVGVALILLILWGVSPGGQARFILLQTSAVVVNGLAIGVSIYYWRRYGASGVLSPMFPPPLPNYSSLSGALNPNDARRVADKEERAALHQLRKGRISRLQYEKIIAYRHFVHGELTRTEYRQIIARLDEGEPKGLQS